MDGSIDPAERKLPEGNWKWTDDTHMALSVTEILLRKGRIVQDDLARLFAERYAQEPWRGYAGGARHLLTLYGEGADWRIEAPRLFNGGSYGNGGAMRAAPVGAYFSGDPERAAGEAKKSAQVTHMHIEGQAGAMAVAAAAAIAGEDRHPAGSDLLEQVLLYLPVTKTREVIEEAAKLDGRDHKKASLTLGSGELVAAFDTVPFCLWVAAHHSMNYETALWVTAEAGGDTDTTCAIVGGIAALTAPVPREWLRHREPLPEGFSL